MSCAVLGQDLDDHRDRQQRAHRLQRYQQRRLQLNDTMSDSVSPVQKPESLSTTVAKSRSTTIVVSDEGKMTEKSPRGAKMPKQTRVSNQGTTSRQSEEACASLWDYTDLPPIAGTPLFTAATARSCSAAESRAFSTAVSLDGNPAVSARVVKQQGALAALGEAALFGGCVLPKTMLESVAAGCRDRCQAAGGE